MRHIVFVGLDYFNSERSLSEVSRQSIVLVPGRLPVYPPYLVYAIPPSLSPSPSLSPGRKTILVHCVPNKMH